MAEPDIGFSDSVIDFVRKKTLTTKRRKAQTTIHRQTTLQRRKQTGKCEKKREVQGRIPIVKSLYVKQFARCYVTFH